MPSSPVLIAPVAESARITGVMMTADVLASRCLTQRSNTVDARKPDEFRSQPGEIVAAATILSQAESASWADADAMHMLGMCHLRRGEPQLALTLLARACVLAPADPITQLHYGLALYSSGQHGDAAVQFRACIPLSPSDPAPYLNLSAALLALGDGRGALDAARRARRRAPRLAQANYMVGMALLALNRLDDAAREFHTALRQAPHLADAWLNIGTICYRRDNIGQAMAAMRRALAVAPEHEAAAVNLGTFMQLTGHGPAGEALLRELLARRPEAAHARVNLAAAMMREERPGEALALLDTNPVPAEQRLACHWQLQRALALIQLGREQEARLVLDAIDEVPPEFAPLLLWRRVLLSLAGGEPGDASRNAQAMEHVLATRPSPIPEHRIMAHFDLARFWSSRGVVDRAFQHWIDGHRLLGRFQPFSRDTHSNLVNALIARFDQIRLTSNARAQNSDPTPVFIVGMPRSGTTLAEQIIAAHSGVFGAGERAALEQVFADLGGSQEPKSIAHIAALGATHFEVAAEQYLSELHALAPDATRIVDKMPGNFLHLGLIALMLPGARIIHCTRDPRDIGLSIFTYRFYGYHPYAHDLGDIGWYITEHLRLMAHWRAVLPNPILTLPLTDWVEDFAGTLRRVLAFLELPYEPACERFYESDRHVSTVSRSQVRQPVNANGVGRWRGCEQQLRPLIAELVAGGALPADAQCFT